MTEFNADQGSSFLPDFCSVRVLFVVLFSAEILAIVLSLNEIIYRQQVLYNLALNSLFILWIALSCVGLLCLFRRYLNQLTAKKAALVSYLIILLVALIITELAWQIVYATPDGPYLISTGHKLFLARTLGIAAIIGGIVLRYLYLQHAWRTNVEAVAESRLQALQSRIRPHFLFNCMNTIASLTRKSPAQAEEAVEDLAELFRASLLEPANLYQITEEWQLCQLYLRIERHRLGERLQINWDIDTLPKDALIPPLCIQPLLENSIYHGIERLADGGVIDISGELLADRVVISVSNPLPTDGAAQVHRGNKHAQENIRQRLLNMFGDTSELSIETSPDRYSVSINLPYQTHADTDR